MGLQLNPELQAKVQTPRRAAKSMLSNNLWTYALTKVRRGDSRCRGILQVYVRTARPP
jgi:hypothetical protein